MSILLGKAAEDLAKTYLIEQGLKFITNNYRCKLGEIDLIMQDFHVLVFIEVKARSYANFGFGLESVTLAKRKKLIKTAMLYLMSNSQTKNLDCRFDIISIDGKTKDIYWVKNAFDMDS